MKHKLFLLIGLALLLSSCAVTTIITSTQQHVVTRIDTVGKHQVRIHIRPIAPPRTSMGNGVKQGDTIKVLQNQILRYK